MSNNNYIHQIISHLAGAATAAAEGVGEFVQGAGSAVNGTFSGVRDSYELGRLRDEQARLFADIGRTLFWVKKGAFSQDGITVEGKQLNAEDAVEQLLEQAMEKQKEIDAIQQRKSERKSRTICPNCSHECALQDVFCPKCGQKLPEKENCGCGCDDAENTGSNDEGGAGPTA